MLWCYVITKINMWRNDKELIKLWVTLRNLVKVKLASKRFQLDIFEQLFEIHTCD